MHFTSRYDNAVALKVLEAMFAGWVCLFSPSFRRKKFQEWRKMGGGRAVAFGVFMYFCGSLLTLALLSLWVWKTWGE